MIKKKKRKDTHAHMLRDSTLGQQCCSVDWHLVTENI